MQHDMKTEINQDDKGCWRWMLPCVCLPDVHQCVTCGEWYRMSAIKGLPLQVDHASDPADHKPSFPSSRQQVSWLLWSTEIPIESAERKDVLIAANSRLHFFIFPQIGYNKK